MRVSIRRTWRPTDILKLSDVMKGHHRSTRKPFVLLSHVLDLLLHVSTEPTEIAAARAFAALLTPVLAGVPDTDTAQLLLYSRALHQWWRKAQKTSKISGYWQIRNNLVKNCTLTGFDDDYATLQEELETRFSIDDCKVVS